MKSLKSILVLSLLIALQTNAWSQPPPPVLFISEIMYHSPALGVDSLEFIEIWGDGAQDFDFTNSYFTSGIEFSFPDGYLHPHGTAVIIAKDSVAFENTFGMEAFQWEGSTSLESIDTISFYWQEWSISSTVSYTNSSPWPPEPDGIGYSLSTCWRGESNPEEWFASQNNTGIIINGITIYADPGVLSGCMSVDIAETTTKLNLKVYPNPTNAMLSVSLGQSIAKLLVYDMLGRVIIQLDNAHSSMVEISISNLRPGIYQVEVVDETGRVQSERILKE